MFLVFLYDELLFADGKENVIACEVLMYIFNELFFVIDDVAENEVEFPARKPLTTMPSVHPQAFTKVNEKSPAFTGLLDELDCEHD